MLCADLLSKAYTEAHLSYGGIPVFHDLWGIDFSLDYVQNTGAAWGMFASFPVLLLVFRILAILLLAIYVSFFHKNPATTPPFLLIIAGALGNVADIFIYGHVVDMFHFVFWGYSFPVFNVADSAIFCGVVWLLLYSYVKYRYAATPKSFS